VHLLLMLIAAIIVVDGLVGDRGLLAMFRARQEGDQLSATIARQRAENARLRDQARRLREDPSAIEEIQTTLRKRLLKAMKIDDTRGQRLVPLREMLQNLQ